MSIEGMYLNAIKAYITNCSQHHTEGGKVGSLSTKIWN